MRKLFLSAKERQKLLSNGVKTIGKITHIKKWWWLKVNTKPIRIGMLDGARFPHTVYFSYTVDGIEYQGRKYLSYKLDPPGKDSEIEIFYDANDPKVYVTK